MDRFLIPEPDGTFHVEAKEILAQVLPYGLNKTKIYALGNSHSGFFSPGPTLLAKQGEDVKVSFRNFIRGEHILKSSIDKTIPWANPLRTSSFDNVTGPVPISFHFHGAFVTSTFDGGPDSWFTNSSQVGSTFTGHSYTYSDLNAGFFFVHDHTMGLSRLNVYAGLLFPVVVQDENEADLPKLIPLLVSDKTFCCDGSLFYPSKGTLSIHPIWNGSFLGDTIVVNGMAWPFLSSCCDCTIRLGLLNACNDRTLVIGFDTEDGSHVRFQIIGSDLGRLFAPTSVFNVTIMPAERFDVLVNISECRPIIVKNFGPDALFEDMDQAPANVNTTGKILKIVPKQTKPGKFVSSLPRPPVFEEEQIKRVRNFDFAVSFTENGPDAFVIAPEGKIETFESCGKCITADEGDTEIWIFNNTQDQAHPMHIHAAEMVILGRKLHFEDNFTLPFPFENGMKDVVSCRKGWTLVRVKFKKASDMGIPFVFHCHMLSHEDNNMMLPFYVNERSSRIGIILGFVGASISILVILFALLLFIYWKKRKSGTYSSLAEA